MNRVTKQMVFARVDRASMFFDIGFNHNITGICITNKKGSQVYTARLTPKEAMIYLEGFSRGVQTVKA